VRRIYATLAADGDPANLMFTPDEQALKCELAPGTFTPVPNAWGARGATTAKLSALSVPELQDALTIAWRHAIATKGRGALGRAPQGWTPVFRKGHAITR
jgi:hypothetical protein